MHIHAHARVNTHARSHVRTHAHAHTHARTHAHTHTHTHTHLIISLIPGGGRAEWGGGCGGGSRGVSVWIIVLSTFRGSRHSRKSRAW